MYIVVDRRSLEVVEAAVRKRDLQQQEMAVTQYYKWRKNHH